MAQAVCPNCSADLGDNVFQGPPPFSCPFCGAGVTELERPNLPVSSSHHLQERVIDLELRPPGNSKIQVVEASRSRYVLHIPAGGQQTKGIGCFALFWNGFLLIFSPSFLIGMGGNGPLGLGLLCIVPFLSIFWIVGLGMAYLWYRLRYTRTNLLIEPERMVLQQILGKRKSMEETTLTPLSRAELVSSYEQNDQPVYAVTVRGGSRILKFGTALSQGEKDWLVKVINDFLGTETSRAAAIGIQTCPACHKPLKNVVLSTETGKMSCPECGASVENLHSLESGGRLAFSPLNPQDLPEDSGVEILDSSSIELRFRLPILTDGPIRTFLGYFFSGLSAVLLVGLGIVLFNERNDLRFGTLLGILGFLIPGSLALVLSALIRRGHITVDLNPDWLHVRWHVGKIGYSRKVHTSSITEVSVGSANLSSGSPRNTIRGSTTNSVPVCLVKAAGKMIPLTSDHGEITACLVAGIVDYQLDRMGFSLETPVKQNG